MSTLNWRSNLRGNLILWDEPSPNVKSVLMQHGKPYDENEFLEAMRAELGESAPTDPRAIRNTAEVLALGGLAHRSHGDQDTFKLTDLGAAAVEFLGLAPETPKVANDSNLMLLGVPYLRGILAVAEYRAIWGLMLRCDGSLSNEELNRFMNRATDLSDCEAVFREIMTARETGDPTTIGPRFYEDDKYSDETRRTDQRKAINPWFLLAGGGWTLISQRGEVSDMRTARPWAIEAVADLIKFTEPEVSVADHEVCHVISKRSGAPRPRRFSDYA